MKKRLILVVLSFLIMLSFPNKVEAMRPGEFATRKECPSIELATAKEDGSLEKVECFEDYNLAKAKMYEITNNDNLVIIENGMIIDTKYGVIDYNVAYYDTATYGNRYGYANVYASANSNTRVGYIKPASNRADDAVIIDFDYATKRVKVKVAGLVGWVDQYDNRLKIYDVVPLVWVKSPQFYKATNDNLRHYLPDNVYDGINNNTYSLVIDKKPEMLNPGDYFSYDGHYFYTDMKVMINDYKAGNYNNAINKNNPYYNYYQYVSFRSKTSYNAANINDYINIRTKGNTNSKLYNTGEMFIWVQEHYGVNAMAILAIGINESGSGTSGYAQNRNNLFGLNAYDANPDSAEWFDSVEDCIKTYGYKWMSYWYLQPGDSHFSGANLGNKKEGLLVKYASDPFWSEKAAHYYYEMDSIYGFQDRNSNLIAVLNNDYYDTVYAYKSVNGTKIGNYFQYKLQDTPVIVKETLKDSNGNIWYKIQADPNLDANLDYIGDSNSNPRYDYNWNGFVYVEAKYFNIVINPDDYDANDVTNVDASNNPIQTISSVMKKANYKYNNGMMSGITLGTKIEEIISNLTNQGVSSVTITDVNGNIKTTGILVTGDKVSITLDNKTDVVNVVIFGDINGDGTVSASDYVQIKNHIMGTNKLTGVYEVAADYDGNNSISASDYVKIKNYIMGK